MVPQLNRRACLAGLAALPLLSAARAPRTVGGVQRLDPALDAVIDAIAPIEVLGEGYTWAEGPVWLRKQGWLLFTDVPGNTIWRWRPGRGTDVFLRPSGLAGPVPDTFNEAGANGLALDRAGRLVLADSGNRAIVRFDLATRRRTVLADRFEGKRFNSPNTVVVARGGAIYFTDPPYGLKDPDRSPLRELDIQSVYRLDPDGRVHLLDGTHRRPNGIALSPDEGTLYLALSDDTRPELLAYPLDAEGRTGTARVFHDMRAQMVPSKPGLPDGVAVDSAGRVFATGPGGVHVLSAQGRLLGIIATGKAIANLCFGERDGRTLFLASHNMLACVRTKTHA